ncbi:hypothetical protein NQ237_24520, partial [Escherichia coli]|nr:hypothetical protein [Escherichia coli]
VTTKRIGKSILEKTLTRWPVFVDHFTNNASAQQSNSIITTQSEDAKNSFESNKFNNMKKMYFALKILLIALGYNCMLGNIDYKTPD